MRHTIIYQEPGRFGGWPANHGIWSWGNEILVGFERAWYQASDKNHSIVWDKPAELALARSLDGGETWQLEQPGALARLPESASPCPGSIDFGNPDFALKSREEVFFVSYDRGRLWQGPYRFNDLGGKLTSRTDYLVQGPQECLFFLSAFEPGVEAGLKDRAFCARTRDGGKTFEFLAWMTGEPLAVRSVMPSTVQCGQGRLVSLLRRRRDVQDGEAARPTCWIDAYHSLDNGLTWDFLSRVADIPGNNGNPPSLARLQDGRLCATYGFRGAPFGLRARLSEDEGSTWGAEIILRDDGRTWDLGYPRTVQRPDGKLVTAYYHTTPENPQQHIAATVWEGGVHSS
jgi:hypothetical protein